MLLEHPWSSLTQIKIFQVTIKQNDNQNVLFHNSPTYHLKFLPKGRWNHGSESLYGSHMLKCFSINGDFENEWMLCSWCCLCSSCACSRLWTDLRLSSNLLKSTCLEIKLWLGSGTSVNLNVHIYRFNKDEESEERYGMRPAISCLGMQLSRFCKILKASDWGINIKRPYSVSLRAEEYRGSIRCIRRTKRTDV